MPIIPTDEYIRAGIKPTKSMLKYSNAVDQYGNIITKNLLNCNLNYDSLYNIMREHSRTEILERYLWIDLPPGLTQDLIERVLYYRGKGVLYYNDKVDKFQFLPFTLNGAIDEYGRYTKVNTLPFTGVDSGDAENSNGRKKKNVKFVYEDLDIVYDLPYNEEMLKKMREKPVGIIINDSSLGVCQQPIIRSKFSEPILRLMSTLIQLINTAIFGAADHNLVQVENENERDSVRNQINAINADILNCNRFTPIIGTFPITPLKTSNTADIEGLFGAFNSASNLLKSINGIANAGVFDKKAHLLQEEQKLNGSNSDDVYYNGLRTRQEALILAQAYYGVGTWCQSKRAMSAAEAENLGMGEIEDPDNTQRSNVGGNEQNGNYNA